MNKTLIYPVNAVFPSREALNKFVERKNLVEGKYLIAGSNSYISFYNPKTHQVELELKGKDIEDLVNSEKEFFQNS